MRINALAVWNDFVESGYLWFFAVVIAWLVIPSVWKDIKHRRAPEYEDRGSLLSRRQGTGRSGKNVHEIYYGTFETDSGQLLELEISRQLYHTLEVGAKGQLYWKGNQLEAFREVKG